MITTPTDIQEGNYTQMKSFIITNSLAHEEKEEGETKRIDVQSGTQKCCVKVYKKGTIQVQGSKNQLKETLEKAKEAIESGSSISDVLPFEIERFPEVLTETIKAIDPVIVRFISEAITSLKAGSLLGCAFLLGGASEKSILILVDSYGRAISDEESKNRFISRTKSKSISKVFDEFKRSFSSSQNKPKDMGWTNDLDVKIEQIFQFCRICRNESGHPHLPPNLDKGVLLANMGQFVKYIEDVYQLIEHYKENNVEL